MQVVLAQTPAVVAGSYVLSEKDGYAGFNYAALYSGASGKMYTKTYDGDAAIIGNNYNIPLEKISRLPGTTGNFLELNASEAWYFDSKRIAIIKQDTVNKIIEHDEWIDYRVKDNIIYYLYAKNGIVAAGHFDGITLHPWETNKELLVTPPAYFLYSSVADHLVFYQAAANTLRFFHLNYEQKKVEQLKEYPVTCGWVYDFKNEETFSLLLKEANKSVDVRNGKLNQPKPFTKKEKLKLETGPGQYPYGVRLAPESYSTILNITNEKDIGVSFLSEGDVNLHFYDSTRQSFYLSTGTKPIRVFTSIKRYPFLFNKSNANSIFSLRQDDKGTVWAGSYNGGISIISNGKTIQLPGITERITNGGSWFNGNMYFVTEDFPNGLIKVSNTGSRTRLLYGTYGFFTLISRDKKYFYYGTGNFNGLWRTATESLKHNAPRWEKIDSAKGIKLLNILTITEDTAGRIWCGHSKRGIAVYNPATGKASSWLVEKKETSWGGYSSLSDARGTVWIGSFGKGLWYYNDYSKEPSPQNCNQLSHPLLNAAKAITSLCIYKDWLVISAYDKMLLLNLDSFHLKKKTVLRYLNPQEAGFTSFTEQNTSLTSIKDSTVWFSTTDMLYQWDIKQWLQLPAPKAGITVIASSPAFRFECDAQKPLSFHPSVSSFDFQVRLLSNDRMPRYISAAVVKDGDSLALPAPSLQNEFELKNIKNGAYRFVVEVYETDGSTTHYEYRFVIRKFLWQQWWFWAFISALIITTTIYFVNIRRKKQIAEQQARTKEAELHTFKAEQEKKLADLRLISLSSQFRPHFILNALNTIGAQMDDKPEAETVLSRLGESVNLIFNHAKNQKTLHSFGNEWKLVENIIHIHRLMYLKQLETSLPDATQIEKLKDLLLPMGILQIPVENALLHGLSNREQKPWKLSISLQRQENGIVVAITDNGVGREKSATLSNYTKHGTGSKNISEIIDIVNNSNSGQISIKYSDGIYHENNITYGTGVHIYIPLNLSYEG